MENQKSKSTFSAILLSLTLMVAAFWVSSAVAAEKKMLKDPATGEMVTVPEYGGTITFARKEEMPGPDTVVSGPWAQAYAAGVSEKLAIADWTTPRDKFDFQFHSPPTH